MKIYEESINLTIAAIMALNVVAMIFRQGHLFALLSLIVLASMAVVEWLSYRKTRDENLRLARKRVLSTVLLFCIIFFIVAFEPR